MDFTFNVEKELATLSENGTYSVRATYTSFGKNPAKLDIRRWKDGLPLKGIQLTDAEARRLCKALIEADYGPED